MLVETETDLLVVGENWRAVVVTELSFVVFYDTAMKTLLKETGFLKAVRTGRVVFVSTFGVGESNVVIHACKGRKERERMTRSMSEAGAERENVQNGLDGMSWLFPLKTLTSPSLPFLARKGGPSLPKKWQGRGVFKTCADWR